MRKTEWGSASCYQDITDIWLLLLTSGFTFSYFYYLEKAAPFCLFHEQYQDAPSHSNSLPGSASWPMMDFALYQCLLHYVTFFYVQPLDQAIFGQGFRVVLCSGVAWLTVIGIEHLYIYTLLNLGYISMLKTLGHHMNRRVMALTSRWHLPQDTSLEIH